MDSKSIKLGLAVAFIFGSLGLLSALVPLSASAATVYLEASRNTISVGDTAIISVKVNADGAVLNTIEGDIDFKTVTGVANAAAVQEFSLANSAFGLWPRTPSLSTDGKKVSFVGGVPGGFSIEGATLFKIIVEAQKEGVVTISPANLAAYLNDGKGTRAPLQVAGLTLNIGPKSADVASVDEWQGMVGRDRTSPEDFIIVLGQDSTLFEGKNFAYFSAVDNQTGIDYYEVSEDGAPAVRSGSTYVLRNQGENAKLSVVAYDKAGNKKTAHYPVSDSISWMFVVIVVGLVLVGYLVFRKIRKAKNNASFTA